MTRSPAEALELARQDADLTNAELWFRVFELGGMSSSLEVDAYLHGALEPSAHEYDVLAHALNERFTELGGDHPVPYSDGEAA